MRGLIGTRCTTILYSSYSTHAYPDFLFSSVASHADTLSAAVVECTQQLHTTFVKRRIDLCTLLVRSDHADAMASSVRVSTSISQK